MRCIFATLLLTIFVCSVAYGQNSNSQPSNTTGQGDSSSKQPQNSGDSSSQQAQQPSPPADSSTPPEKKQSAVKRKLKELVPSCANVGAYVKCKASKPEKAKDPGPDNEYAKDMDVGDFYLNERKNYAGAMMRFRDALEQKPNDPLATFKLAQALEGLKQNDEAREDYAAYLKLEPKGPHVGESQQALDRLQPQNADKAKEAPAPKDSHEL